jgi:serine/threonine protein kinase
MTLPGSRYEFGRRLGGGGMAEVFLATVVGAEGFQRQVAIKRVLPSYSGDATFAQMFINEAQISSLLNHPNIVSTLDFDRDAEGRLFLVMDYVDGKDLVGLLETGPLPWAVTIHVIVEVLRGLGHAHDATGPAGKRLGIVHRDVSPHNVLLSFDGAVKVSDFGIAKAFQASNAQHSSMLKGKAAYMSPEQIHAAPDLDGRSDLFAVGVMLHEMLTGQRLFGGDSIEQVLTGVIRYCSGLVQLPHPVEVRPDAPPDLSAVAMRLLAVHREDRFQRAEHAIDALLSCRDASVRGRDLLVQVMAERFGRQLPTVIASVPSAPGMPLSRQPTRTIPPGATRTLAPPPTPPGYAAAVHAPSSPRRRSRVALIASLGAFAFAGTGIAAFVVGNGAAPAPARSPGPAATPLAEAATIPDAAMATTPDAAVPPTVVADTPAPDTTMAETTVPRAPVDAPPPAASGRDQGDDRRHEKRRREKRPATAESASEANARGIEEIQVGGSR